MDPLILTDENFGENVLNSQKPVLVDFWSSWCTPCKFLAPILEKVLKDFEDKIIFAKLNIDDAPLTANNYQIQQIPTVMLFKEGKPISFFIGVQKEDIIKQWIEENIK
jgi:thioredoxin 1